MDRVNPGITGGASFSPSGQTKRRIIGDCQFSDKPPVDVFVSRENESIKTETLPCTKPSLKEEKGEKEVTFLYYLNGQFSDLEQAAASTILGLEQTGSDENVNLVAQLGRAAQNEVRPNGGFDRIDNDWSGVQRYYVVKSPVHHNVEVPVHEWHKIKERIPENPLIHFTLGEAYKDWDMPEESEKHFDEAKRLGYEKFLDSPFDPDVGKWGAEFDRELQPLRDAQADTNTFASPVVERKNGVSMMHPYSLQDFVAWGMKNYPAKHYVLVLAGHGGAWTGSMKMSPSEISMAVQAGVQESNRKTGRFDHLDGIVFNSCYMGNLESVHQMKDAADVTIASQMSARASVFYQWPHIIEKLQQSLNDGEKFDAKAMAKDFVEYYRKMGEENQNNPDMVRRSKETYLTLVALDNDKVADITDSWAGFISDWKESGVPDYKIFGHIGQAKNYPSASYSPEMMFDYGTLRDIGSIAYNVINDPEMPMKLRADCQKIRRALRRAIISEQHTGHEMTGSTGLTVWAPTNAADIALMKEKYDDRVPAFVQETGWSEKMSQLMENVDNEKLNEFLQTIQMLGNVRKMMEVPVFDQREMNNLAFKSELLEKEAAELRAELDLSAKKPGEPEYQMYEELRNDGEGNFYRVVTYKPQHSESQSGDNLGHMVVESVKEDIKLPPDNKSRKKLQDEVADGIIRNADRANGMASGEARRSKPAGSNLTKINKTAKPV